MGEDSGQGGSESYSRIPAVAIGTFRDFREFRIASTGRGQIVTGKSHLQAFFRPRAPFPSIGKEKPWRSIGGAFHNDSPPSQRARFTLRHGQLLRYHGQNVLPSHLQNANSVGVWNGVEQVLARHIPGQGGRVSRNPAKRGVGSGNLLHSREQRVQGRNAIGETSDSPPSASLCRCDPFFQFQLRIFRERGPVGLPPGNRNQSGSYIHNQMPRHIHFGLDPAQSHAMPPRLDIPHATPPQTLPGNEAVGMSAKYQIYLGIALRDGR